MRILFFQLKAPLTDPWTGQIIYGQHYLSGLQKCGKQLDKMCALKSYCASESVFL